MRFLPREEKFFELFLDHIKLSCEAATALLNGVSAGNAHLSEAAEHISELEHKADEITHLIFTRLNQTFITPLDPEDIHSLSTHLDNVIDGMEESAHRMVAYNIEPIPAVVIDVCRNLLACVESLRKAFDALKSNERLVEHCIEVNRVEGATDRLVRDAIKVLFQQETDPIRIMKLKEIYDLLEETTDFCEDVAVALQNVVVKNS